MTAESLTDDRKESLRSLAGILDGFAHFDEGRPGAARARFQAAALASAREPTMEAGIAHRSLAEIDAMEGDLAGVEAHLKRAVTTFREVARLQRSLKVRAQEAEASCLLLGGEVMNRRGQSTAGDALLGRARVLLDRLGDERSGEAWLSTARLARLAGDPAGADKALSVAIDRYERAENVVGHAEGLIELAMLRRGQDADGALRMIDLAATMARDAGRIELLSRTLLARGMVLEDASSARDAYDEALQRALQSGSRPLAGLALVGLGTRGWEGGERALLAGVQVLLDCEHYPAFGLGLLRTGQHANRTGDPDLALAAAEAAWRVFRAMDPGEGLARVLRLVEQAFVQLRMPRALLTTVFARAALVGRKDPSAIALRDHYASRAPAAWVSKLAGSSRDALLSEARRALQAAVIPALRRFGLLASSFATAQGALDVIGVLAGVSTRAAARQLAPWSAQQIPNDLPPVEIQSVLGAQFAVRNRISVPVTPALTPSAQRGARPRRPLYDPDGRLAEIVAGSLDFVSDDPLARLPRVPGQGSGLSEDSEFPPDGSDDWRNEHTGEAPGEDRDDITEEAPRPAAPEERPRTFDPSGWNSLLGEGWAAGGGAPPDPRNEEEFPDDA